MKRGRFWSQTQRPRPPPFGVGLVGQAGIPGKVGVGNVVVALDGHALDLPAPPPSVIVGRVGSTAFTASARLAGFGLELVHQAAVEVDAVDVQPLVLDRPD